MGKEDLIIKELDAKTDFGAKAHFINGMPFTCPGSEDCQLCQEEKRRKIKAFLNSVPYPKIEWSKWRREGIPTWAIGRTIKDICRKCKHEVMPCYQCTKKDCEQWGKDPNLRGQEKACPHFFEGMCKTWRCTRKEPIITRPWEEL